MRYEFFFCFILMFCMLYCVRSACMRGLVPGGPMIKYCEYCDGKIVGKPSVVRRRRFCSTSCRSKKLGFQKGNMVGLDTRFVLGMGEIGKKGCTLRLSEGLSTVSVDSDGDWNQDIDYEEENW